MECKLSSVGNLSRSSWLLLSSAVTMAGWDEANVYYANQGLVEQVDDVGFERRKIENEFFEFIRLFRANNAFKYREKIRRQCRLKQYVLEVDIDDLATEKPDLADQLKSSPTVVLPEFEKAATRVARDENRIQLNHGDQVGEDDNLGDDDLLQGGNGATPLMQVILRSREIAVPLRSLTAIQISSLVVIQGIVISASRTRPKATKIEIMCSNCNSRKTLTSQTGYSHISLPVRCDALVGSDTAAGQGEKCPLDPYIVLPDECSYVDCQTMRLQEPPELVPTGEMPRHVVLSCERHLVDQVVPGTRVTVIGVYTIFEGGKKDKDAGKSAGVAIRVPYVHAVGLQVDDPSKGIDSLHFSPEEEDDFAKLGRLPNLYDIITQSIAPAIYGLADIKKAVACQLFGGSRKHLPDGMQLRGDINVLLLGDPGTAKSQMLKFAEKVAPIAVYTSGKGSSAAGLTASVIRDPSSREFYLEVSLQYPSFLNTFVSDTTHCLSINTLVSGLF